MNTSSGKDCKLGNSVLLEDLELGSNAMSIHEIAIIKHDGKLFLRSKICNR